VTLPFDPKFCSSMKRTLYIIMTSTISTDSITFVITNSQEPSIQMQKTFGFETRTMHRPTNLEFKLNYFSLEEEGGNQDQTPTWRPLRGFGAK